MRRFRVTLGMFFVWSDSDFITNNNGSSYTLACVCGMCLGIPAAGVFQARNELVDLSMSVHEYRYRIFTILMADWSYFLFHAYN